MRSIQSRLGMGLIVSLVGLFGLQWFIVGGSIRDLAEGYVASRLQRDAESLLAALATPDAPGEPSLDPLRIDPVYKRPFSGHYYQIAVGGHRLRSRSLWDQELTVPTVGRGTTLQTNLSGPQNQSLLVVVHGFKKRESAVTIAVAEDLSQIEVDIRAFQLRYGLVSLVVLVALIVIQRLVVRSGLAPLDKTRRDLAALERGESRRLDDAAPAEVQPLIGQINRLLEAMTQRLHRSRHALGNLAHALKTPLTLLVQLADRDELRNSPELRRQLTEQTQTLRTLMDRELKRTRLAGAARPGQTVVLREEIDHLLDALAKIYREKTVAVDCSLPPGGTIAADREDLLELLGNLLDNAFKWSRGRVSLGVESNGGVVFCVEDDGPGCPPDELTRLSLRGVRVDESAAGHGIGLAIVRDIVAQYRGTLTFGRSERLGGFQARVTLPVQSAPTDRPLNDGRVHDKFVR